MRRRTDVRLETNRKRRSALRLAASVLTAAAHGYTIGDAPFKALARAGAAYGRAYRRVWGRELT